MVVTWPVRAGPFALKFVSMCQAGAIRVLVADPHPVYRHGLMRAIDADPALQLVEACAEGTVAMQRIGEIRPDVAVIAIPLPGVDGIALAARLWQSKANTRILMLSASVDPALVYAALQAGVTGYLSKETEDDLVCAAIATVARGGSVLGPELHTAIAEQIRSHSSEPRTLSLREHEILALVADGHTAGEIAQRLFLGTSTVRTHLQHIYAKLGTKDRSSAVATGIRQGLIG
jgi:two-component system, NarL family, nitrate/nitrite response regulator NarL